MLLVALSCKELHVSIKINLTLSKFRGNAHKEDGFMPWLKETSKISELAAYITLSTSHRSIVESFHHAATFLELKDPILISLKWSPCLNISQNVHNHRRTFCLESKAHRGAKIHPKTTFEFLIANEKTNMAAETFTRKLFSSTSKNDLRVFFHTTMFYPNPHRKNAELKLKLSSL